LDGEGLIGRTKLEMVVIAVAVGLELFVCYGTFMVVWSTALYGSGTEGTFIHP
jgi:hypothetical protein